MENSIQLHESSIDYSLQSINSCGNDILKDAFFKHGFDGEKLKNYFMENFLSCINTISIPGLKLDIEKDQFQVEVLYDQKIISLDVTLPINIKTNGQTKQINSFLFELSRINYENLDIENGILQKDTMIFSSDSKAVLYLGEGTELDYETKSIMIETLPNQDADLLEGKFTYKIHSNKLEETKLSSPAIIEIPIPDDTEDPRKLRITQFDESLNEWTVIPTLIVHKVHENTEYLKAIVSKFGTYGVTAWTKTAPKYDGNEDRNSQKRIYFPYNQNNEKLDKIKLVNYRESYDPPSYTSPQYETPSPKGDTPDLFGLDNNIYYEKIEDNPDTTLTGELTYGEPRVYEIKSKKNVPKIFLEETNNPNLEIATFSMFDRIKRTFVLLNGEGEFIVTVQPPSKGPETIHSPYAKISEGVSHCFDGVDYTIDNSAYVHVGTDFIGDGKIKAACDGKVVDIWTYNWKKGELEWVSLNPSCVEKLKEENSPYLEYIRGNRYKKAQPAEPYIYDVRGAVNEKNRIYDHAVVIECNNKFNGHTIQTIYAHMAMDANFLTVREDTNPNTPGIDTEIPIDENGDRKKICPGQDISVGTYFGDVGDHLHFEIRFGTPGENGLVEKIMVLNPIVLDKEYGGEEQKGILSDELRKVLDAGSYTQDTCDKDVYFIAGIQDQQFWGTA